MRLSGERFNTSHSFNQQRGIIIILGCNNNSVNQNNNKSKHYIQSRNKKGHVMMMIHIVKYMYFDGNKLNIISLRLKIKKKKQNACLNYFFQ